MRAKIAVATVCGKDYYLIVDELKRRNRPFLSLTPSEPIPIGIKVVITTEKERDLVKHQKVLTIRKDMTPEVLVNEASRIAQGKETYEKITIGVDPGEVFGLAVLVDGVILETGNSFSLEETSERISRIVSNFKGTSVTSISVKIGNGVPWQERDLLNMLDEHLPANVSLESVSEVGTNRSLNDEKHRRGLRDIASAIQIAGRRGHRFHRRKTIESNS